MATSGADTHVDLFGAAMAIARLRGVIIDPHAVAREFDLIAEAVHERVEERAGPHVLVSAVNAELFDALGFKGNAENYNDPENSYLDRVIARRTGIPITLSLVYMEVAQRVGLRCDGVGFPGHFLVRCGEPTEPIFVDPFHGGAEHTPAELLARLATADLGGATPESFLAAVTRRQLLQRMLANLHTVFREGRDTERWLATVELQLRIEPWNALLVGERGMLHYRLGRPDLALADLERYVKAAPRAAVGARLLLNQLRHIQRTSEDQK